MNTRIIISVLFPVWLLFPPLIDLNNDWTLEGSAQLSPDNIEERFNQCIEKGDLLTPAGSSAYDAYQLFLQEQPENHTTQRSLKRKLVANLVGAADQSLTLYFEHGGYFLQLKASEKIKNIELDKYYAVAAELMGEDHYLYKGLVAKSLFTEALRLRYTEQGDLTVIKAKLEKSLSLDAFASFTYNELGQVYFAEGNYSAACNQFRQAIKWNSNWKMPRQNLQTTEAALLQSQKK